MKAPLYKITVVCLNTDKKTVTDIILKSEAFHPKNESTETPDNEKLKRLEESRQNQEEALDILNKYIPEKKALFSLPKPYASAFTPKKDKSMDILSVKNKLLESKAKTAENKKIIQQLIPFKGFDLPLEEKATLNTKCGVFTAEKEVTAEHLNKLFGDIYTEIILSFKKKTAIFVIYPKNNSKEILQRLQNEGFSRLELNTQDIPKNEIHRLECENKKLQEEALSLEEKIKKLADERGNIKLLSDINQTEKEKIKAFSLGKETKRLFITEGFIAKAHAKKLKDRLESSAKCYVYFSEPEKGEEIPVLFHNNSFSAPVEEITRTYAVPSKRDIDPNSIMAVFYYLFFGMMFSDAGYGLLVSLFCGYMAFFSKTAQKTKNTMRLFFYCGISTLFWGLMFGSFFGDAVSVISRTFLGKDYSLPPLWLDPTKEPLILLVFSVALGIVQILTGMGIRFYTLCRQKLFQDAFFDVGSWILILLGVVFLGIGFILKISFINIFGLALCAVGAATIVLMKGREKKNPAARLFSGVLGLYDITGIVSDSLSYSRLMALGLSTGVIASVVNMMGSLSGNGIIGIFVFCVVFIVGHSLNFAINMLGAYVHTNRLQYVEFFSKFYEGGGKAFTPLRFNTKYYEFSDRKD